MGVIGSLLLTSAGNAASVGATLEDPGARAALPEFKYIPAAKPEELTLAADVAMGQFARVCTHVTDWPVV